MQSFCFSLTTNRWTSNLWTDEPNLVFSMANRPNGHVKVCYFSLPASSFDLTSKTQRQISTLKIKLNFLLGSFSLSVFLLDKEFLARFLSLCLMTRPLKKYSCHRRTNCQHWLFFLTISIHRKNDKKIIYFHDYETIPNIDPRLFSSHKQMDAENVIDWLGECPWMILLWKSKQLFFL